MRKLVLVILVILLPLTGVAQQVGPTTPTHRTSVLFKLNRITNISNDRAIALGIGALVGAIGLHALLGGVTWAVVGALVGVLFGDWWFIQRSSQTGGIAGDGPVIATL